jgi:hypothetical protein
MKQSRMSFLAPIETVSQVGERVQAAHGVVMILDDAPLPEHCASDTCAQHPKYCQG